MKIDTHLVSALAEELNRELAGSRIEKVQQPAKDIVILTVRNKKVLLSVRNNYSRIHITEQSYDNPKEPPMFCMLLRKHILGSFIVSIQQKNDDRVIEIDLINNDELGRNLKEKLIIEMIPKTSNIVLTDDNYLIIDCIRRKDFDANMYRRVFPGNIYRFPLKPNVSNNDASSCDLSDISKKMDAYFSYAEKNEIIQQKAKETRTKIVSSIKRIERKVGAQKQDLLRTVGRDEVKHKADLITANIYRIRQGQRVLECEDFYNNNEMLEIKLDPLLSPQKNAAKLYKEYNKLKTAESYLINLISTGEDQLDYLYSTLDQLKRASCEADINDLRNELIETGFIKAKESKRKIDRPQPPIVQGNLLIGRNNKQNDELTFKIARKTDWWFHAKGYHGSHVILKADSPTDEMIQEACTAAAKYSEADGNCPVDYCQVKYVKKPSGALPGKVIYTNYKTRLV